MWLLMALSCAFFTATSTSISKIILKRNDEYLVGWLGLVMAAPFLLFILFWIDIPGLDIIFYRSAFILLPLEILAYLLYIKAIKYSPLSLTLPFLALTPVFLILTGWLILRERVGFLGIAGIVLVAAGVYLLNIETFHMGLLEPVRSIFKERGSVYMIIVAFIYSITSALGKLAIAHSSVLFFSAVYYPALSVLLIPLVAVRYKQGLLKPTLTGRDHWLLLLIGFIFSLSVITHCFGITMTKAAYMITVKRLSMIFGVIYGWLLFKESHIANRLAAVSLMGLGVLLISITH